MLPCLADNLLAKFDYSLLYLSPHLASSTGMILEVTDMMTPSCACIATKMRLTPAMYCASVYSNGDFRKSTMRRHPMPASTASAWSSTLLGSTPRSKTKRTNAASTRQTQKASGRCQRKEGGGRERGWNGGWLGSRWSMIALTL